MPELTIGILLFLLLLAAEWGLSRLLRRDTFRARDTIANLSLGIVERSAWLIPLAVLPTSWEDSAIGLFHWPRDSGLTWVCAFLLTDFTDYWLHRLHHRLAPLWALHAIHHQSREFNYSVGLRVSALQTLTMLPSLLLVLLAFGFDLKVILIISSLFSALQLLGHTQLVGRLPALDLIFATPSNHRVHHGLEKKYQDHNFGAVLIIWDRLFGTYQREEEPPTYGTEATPKSASPISALLFEWRRLFGLDFDERQEELRPSRQRLIAASAQVTLLIVVNLVLIHFARDVPIWWLGLSFLLSTTWLHYIGRSLDQGAMT